MNKIQQFVWGRPSKPPLPQVKNYNNVSMKLYHQGQVSSISHQNLHNGDSNFGGWASFDIPIEFPFQFHSEDANSVRYSCQININQNWIGYNPYVIGSNLERFKGLEYYFETGMVEHFQLVMNNSPSNVVKFDKIRFYSEPTGGGTLLELNYIPDYGIISNNSSTSVLNERYVFKTMHQDRFRMSSDGRYGGYPFREDVSDMARHSGEFYFRFEHSQSNITSKMFIMTIVGLFEYRPD